MNQSIWILFGTFIHSSKLRNDTHLSLIFASFALERIVP